MRAIVVFRFGRAGIVPFRASVSTMLSTAQLMAINIVGQHHLRTDRLGYHLMYVSS